MGNIDRNINLEPSSQTDANGEYSIFDEVKPPLHLYPKYTIYWLSILFGSLFGSILMALNFKKTEDKKGIVPVLIFGVLVMILHITTRQLINNRSLIFSLVFNITGAKILKDVFWRKYIGDNITYNDRSALIPGLIVLAIGLVLSFFIYLLGSLKF